MDFILSTYKIIYKSKSRLLKIQGPGEMVLLDPVTKRMRERERMRKRDVSLRSLNLSGETSGSEAV